VPPYGKECPPQARRSPPRKQPGEARPRIRDAVDRLSRETELLAVSRITPANRSAVPSAVVSQPGGPRGDRAIPVELLAWRSALSRRQDAGRRAVGPGRSTSTSSSWGRRGSTAGARDSARFPGRRRFCLLPARSGPGAVVPTYGRTVSQLLDACEDTLEVIAFMKRSGVLLLFGLLLALAAVLSFTGCKKKEPRPVGEVEPIRLNPWRRSRITRRSCGRIRTTCRR